jgi:hypothetical protein
MERVLLYLDRHRWAKLLNGAIVLEVLDGFHDRSFMASSNSSDKDISRLLQRLKDFTCIFTVGQTTYTDALVLPFWNKENDLGLISNDP